MWACARACHPAHWSPLLARGCGCGCGRGALEAGTPCPIPHPLPCYRARQVLKYFSYEHFYVIYCKFWELDSDHDFLIDRNDLAHYSQCALSFQIVDQVFEQVRGFSKEERLKDFIHAPKRASSPGRGPAAQGAAAAAGSRRPLGRHTCLPPFAREHVPHTPAPGCAACICPHAPAPPAPAPHAPAPVPGAPPGAAQADQPGPRQDVVRGLCVVHPK